MFTCPCCFLRRLYRAVSISVTISCHSTDTTTNSTISMPTKGVPSKPSMLPVYWITSNIEHHPLIRWKVHWIGERYGAPSKSQWRQHREHRTKQYTDANHPTDLVVTKGAPLNQYVGVTKQGPTLMLNMDKQRNPMNKTRLANRPWQGPLGV